MRHRIVNWREYQHYKGRRPPWIKVHKSILASPDWVMGSDASKLLAIVCMMAAQMDKACDGSFNSDPVFLKKIASLDAIPCLKELVTSGFLVEVQDASKLLAKEGQSVLPSVSVSVSVCDSVSEGGMGENYTAEEFVGPIRKKEAENRNPIHDFSADTQKKAIQAWQWYCMSFNGSIMDTNRPAYTNEIRSFAKAIEANSDGFKKLEELYSNPLPAEMKQLVYFKLIEKLGLDGSSRTIKQQAEITVDQVRKALGVME